MEYADVATPSFASRLRRARERAGLSAEQLAAAAGLERTAVYRIEAKDAPDPRLSTVVAIAKALNVSLDELVGLKPAAKGKRDPKSRKAAALLREAAELLEE